MARESGMGVLLVGIIVGLLTWWWWAYKPKVKSKISFDPATGFEMGASSTDAASSLIGYGFPPV